MTRPSLRDGMFRLLKFNVLTFVVRLVTSAIVARVMGPAAMGVWLLLSLLPTYAEGFGRLKADLAAVYVLGQGRWSLGEVAMALNVIALVSGGACAVGLIVAQPLVVPWLFGPEGVAPWLYLATVLIIPVHFLAMGYAYLLLHLEDVTAYNIQSAFRSVFAGVLASALLLLTDLRVSAMVLSLLLGAVLGLGYGAWQVHRRTRLERPHSPGLYLALVNFARRLYVAGVIEHLNLYLSSLLVGVRLSTQELAFFRLGQDRLQILDQVPSAVNTLLYPRLSKTSVGDAQVELVARSMRVLLILLTLSAVLGGLLAPLAVWMLYGSEFMPMIWSIWLLLPGVCAIGITSPVTQYFMGSGRPELVWRLALVPLALQLAMLVPMIDFAGFRGAALAVSLSFVVHAAVRLHLLARVVGWRVRRLVIPTRDDIDLVKAFALERLGRSHRKTPDLGFVDES
jgi:O-antigen/teichoic acid export membrane protein